MTSRVLVTRADEQSSVLATALSRHGLEAVVVPAIAVEIDPPGGGLDAAARALHTFDWVVITSPNGARAILTAAERVPTALEAPLWAAIGTASAHLLEEEGIKVDFQPRRAYARDLASELPIRPGQKVLLLRGDLAGGDLPDRLRERAAQVTDIVAYRNVEAPSSSRSALRDAVAPGLPAAVLFASGSAVRGLTALAGEEGLDLRPLPAICIGMETAREAGRLGYEVIGTAPTPDVATLAATAARTLAQPAELP